MTSDPRDLLGTVLPVDSADACRLLNGKLRSPFQTYFLNVRCTIRQRSIRVESADRAAGRPGKARRGPNMHRL
jgi:hypothetical protein